MTQVRRSRKGNKKGKETDKVRPCICQVLYSRLHLFKNIAMERVNDPAFDANSNVTAMDIELMQAIPGSQNGQGQGQVTALQYYELVLETCERLFDNQVEQPVFEDQMREMFGLHASFFFSSPWSIN
jgi:paired amphipathic helix protein Sin3a